MSFLNHLTSKGLRLFLIVVSTSMTQVEQVNYLNEVLRGKLNQILTQEVHYLFTWAE